MVTDRLTSELEAEFGQQLRLLRLRQNIDQRQLAGQAGVALNVVKRLEAGRGATLKSLIRVLRALGRTGVPVSILTGRLYSGTRPSAEEIGVRFVELHYGREIGAGLAAFLRARRR